MRAGIHPEAVLCKVSCTCGNTFEIISEKATMSVGLCSACHPFYTGQQKYVDSAGRVDRFAQRYNLTNDHLHKLSQVKEPKKKKAKLEHKINPKAKPTARVDFKAAKAAKAETEKKNAPAKES